MVPTFASCSFSGNFASKRGPKSCSIADGIVWDGMGWDGMVWCCYDRVMMLRVAWHVLRNTARRPDWERQNILFGPRIVLQIYYINLHKYMC